MLVNDRRARRALTLAALAACIAAPQVTAQNGYYDDPRDGGEAYEHEYDGYERDDQDRVFGDGAARFRSELGVELWTEREPGWTYATDEIATVHFRASDDAYVVVYGTDVYGAVRLLYPVAPRHARRVRGGRVYTIDAHELHVAGADGLVHVQALASAYPLEPHLPAFFHARGPRHRPHRVGHQSGLVVRLGFVTGDPYLAFADLRAAIVPRGCAPQFVGYATLSYSIGPKAYYYPRYLCNDCHHGGWYDPYHDSCSVFEVRIDSFWHDIYPYYVHCQPRYYYWKRASVPVRYRHYKTKWSSKDRSADMVRYFAGKSVREREHVSARTKPVRVRDGRARDGRDEVIDAPRSGKNGNGGPTRGDRDVRGRDGRDRGGAAERPGRDARETKDRKRPEKARARAREPEREPERGGRVEKKSDDRRGRDASVGSRTRGSKSPPAGRSGARPARRR